MKLAIETDRTILNELVADPTRRSVDILGISLDRLRRAEVLELIELYIAQGTPHQIVTVNTDFLNIADRDPGFITLLNNTSLAVADGMPLLWLSRLLGAPLPERITGSDLLLGSAEIAARQGYRIFLLGAAEGVAAEVSLRLEERFPGLKIAGHYSPPEIARFDPLEDERMVAAVTAARPDMLFVALGTPKQERWLFERLDQLNVPVCVGVGGVFNFIAGRVPRAPQLMQQLGLEWLFRLLCEPQRLWRRYLVEDTRVLARAIVQIAGHRSRQPSWPEHR